MPSIRRPISNSCTRLPARRHCLWSFGLASTAVTLGVAATALHKGWQAPKLLETLHHHLGLPGGDFLKLPDLPTLLFWSIPTYGAYLSAASDRYEVKELVLKFGVFCVGFFGFPKLVEPCLVKQAAKVGHHPWLGGPENIAYAGQFAASTLVLGCAPPIMNIFLTHWRVQRDEQRKAIGYHSQPLHVARVTSGLTTTAVNPAPSWTPSGYTGSVMPVPPPVMTQPTPLPGRVESLPVYPAEAVNPSRISPISPAASR